MREIKFRVWDKWIKKILIVDELIWSKKTGEIKLIYSNKDFKQSADIKDKVLTQFTGLKDKNGKEIYEGDIILTDQIVVWSDESCNRGDNELNCWGIQKGKYNIGAYSHHENFEVIGNKFENPELLEDLK